jgi:hypothetical protein
VHGSGKYPFTVCHRTGGIASLFCHDIPRERAIKDIFILNVFTGSMLRMSYGLGEPDLDDVNLQN